MAALLGFGVAAIFAVTADIRLAASVTDFAVYAIFIVVNLSVIVLRKAQPEIQRSITVPFTYRDVPLLPIAAIATVLVMLARLDSAAWLLGALALVAGIGVWVLLRLARPVAERAAKGS
jgi:APA family basic amino acid/polyamine antiporter